MEISDIDDYIYNWCLTDSDSRSRHPKNAEYQKIYRHFWLMVYEEKYSNCDIKGVELGIYAHQFNEMLNRGKSEKKIEQVIDSPLS